VLFVGPHHPYLHYVADVLPSLGEDDVRTCTLVDMVAEGQDAIAEADPEVARLKHSRQMVGAIDLAVALYEEPPTADHVISTDWGGTCSSARRTGPMPSTPWTPEPRTTTRGSRSGKSSPRSCPQCSPSNTRSSPTPNRCARR